MNLKEIKELVEFVVRQDLSEFEVERSGFRMRIRRGNVTLPTAAAPQPVSAAPAAPPLVLAEAHSPLTLASAPEAVTDIHIINSPIVGTLYRSSSPDADPFVKVGDFVEKGTVLCIIEAMKLMNEIESEVSGEVTQIFIQSGHPVEYGEPLFAVRLRS